MSKPRVAIAKRSRVKQLETKAGATPRVRGRVWMSKRIQIAKRSHFRCAHCGQAVFISADPARPTQTGDVNQLRIFALVNQFRGNMGWERNVRIFNRRAAGIRMAFAYLHKIR